MLSFIHYQIPVSVFSVLAPAWGRCSCTHTHPRLLTKHAVAELHLPDAPDFAVVLDLGAPARAGGAVERRGPSARRQRYSDQDLDLGDADASRYGVAFGCAGHAGRYGQLCRVDGSDVWSAEPTDAGAGLERDAGWDHCFRSVRLAWIAKAL